MVPLKVQVDPRTKKRLQKLVERKFSHLSLNAYVNIVLLEHLDKVAPAVGVAK